jgi:hypothetical protein
MLFQAKTFTNGKIELDFNRFEKCVFQKCQIIYRGFTPPDFYECRFENCDYTFDGPAGNLITFLRTMHASPAREVADKIVAHIQGGGAASAVVSGVTH